MSELDEKPIHDAESIISLIMRQGRSILVKRGGFINTFRGYKMPNDVYYRHENQLVKIFSGTVFTADLSKEGQEIIDSVQAHKKSNFFKNTIFGDLIHKRAMISQHG